MCNDSAPSSAPSTAVLAPGAAKYRQYARIHHSRVNTARRALLATQFTAPMPCMIWAAVVRKNTPPGIYSHGITFTCWSWLQCWHYGAHWAGLNRALHPSHSPSLVQPSTVRHPESGAAWWFVPPPPNRLQLAIARRRSRRAYRTGRILGSFWASSSSMAACHCAHACVPVCPAQLPAACTVRSASFWRLGFFQSSGHRVRASAVLCARHKHITRRLITRRHSTRGCTAGRVRHSPPPRSRC